MCMLPVSPHSSTWRCSKCMPTALGKSSIQQHKFWWDEGYVGCQLLVHFSWALLSSLFLTEMFKLYGRCMSNLFLRSFWILNVLSEVISLSYNYSVCFTPFYSLFAGLGNKYAGLRSKSQLPDLMNAVSSKVAAKQKQISLQLGLTHNDQKCFMFRSSNSIAGVYFECSQNWK